MEMIPSSQLLSLNCVNLDHYSPDSMPGCSTGSAQCQSAALWCQAPAPHCPRQTSEAASPPCKPGATDIFGVAKKKQQKINTQQKKNLGIKRIIVKQISTMECFAVGLVKSYHVLLSSEYFNLKICIYEEFVKENIHFDLICCLWTTSGEWSLFSD